MHKQMQILYKKRVALLSVTLAEKSSLDFVDAMQPANNEPFGGFMHVLNSKKRSIPLKHPLNSAPSFLS